MTDYLNTELKSGERQHAAHQAIASAHEPGNPAGVCAAALVRYDAVTDRAEAAGAGLLALGSTAIGFQFWHLVPLQIVKYISLV
jgi:hypothetical protein